MSAEAKVQRTYHTKATGNALHTVERRSHNAELKLFGSCFCPFVQRVWIALELSGLEYQYIEVDPYKKPKELMDVNPRGLVPALKHEEWGCYESTVLMEYIDEIANEKLLPQTPKEKAHSRLWADHISRNIVPNFYRYLQAQETDKQAEHGREFEKQVNNLLDAADREGPFFTVGGPPLPTKTPTLWRASIHSAIHSWHRSWVQAKPKFPKQGSKMTFVDIMVAPWILRCPRVLQPYRGWEPPTKESRFGRFIAALEAEEAIIATTSGDELYLDSYERYAENRPNTSQVAKAINEGRGLP